MLSAEGEGEEEKVEVKVIRIPEKPSQEEIDRHNIMSSSHAYCRVATLRPTTERQFVPDRGTVNTYEALSTETYAMLRALKMLMTLHAC